MKKAILTFLIVYSIQYAHSQNKLKDIQRATWVVESNVSNPKNQVIKFYNSSFDLIYQETVSNKRIRYEKAHVRKALNKTLELALNNENVIQPGTFALLLKRKSEEIKAQK